MRNRFLFYIFLLIQIPLLDSCKNPMAFDEYVNYLKAGENGLSRLKTVDGIIIKVMYLPIDYQVFNEIKLSESFDEKQVDSLRQTYSSSCSFLMTIGPEDKASVDITKMNVSNYEQFSEKILEMSFNMGTMVKMRSDGKEYIPEIAQLERNFGIRKSTDILFVFNIPLSNLYDQTDYEFVFSDEVFNTGINKFKFLSKDIKNIPKLKFI
ncbi:MAG: hypothetical protein M3Q58_12440 [Bacteroidota bacterium]|nr:hypothetical protein [Bacteroidota bacterium]